MSTLPKKNKRVWTLEYPIEGFILGLITLHFLAIGVCWLDGSLSEKYNSYMHTLNQQNESLEKQVFPLRSTPVNPEHPVQK